jgi:2-phospho-L-lactate guanylyltransferase (CobY/MobA/RfbA family)
MTVVAVTVDPPREGVVLPRLSETSPLSEREVVSLYRAMVADAFEAAATSGGDLLVNYRPDDQLPDEYVPEDGDAEAEVRELLTETLDDEAVEDARVEVQVGSSKAARVGNTVTHLLDSEGVNSVTVLEPDAPLFRRKDLDSAAMKLRRSPVVLGPAQGGDVYFAGFSDPVDFTDAFETPALETLTASAQDAGYDVDFLSRQTRVRTGEDLCTLVPEIRARRAANRLVPAHTTARIEELDLRVEDADGERVLVRD